MQKIFRYMTNCIYSVCFKIWVFGPSKLLEGAFSKGDLCHQHVQTRDWKSVVRCEVDEAKLRDSSVTNWQAYSWNVLCWCVIKRMRPFCLPDRLDLLTVFDESLWIHYCKTSLKSFLQVLGSKIGFLASDSQTGSPFLLVRLRLNREGSSSSSRCQHFFFKQTLLSNWKFSIKIAFVVYHHRFYFV